MERIFYFMEKNIYLNYYWQDEKIRLRFTEPKDAEVNIQIALDNEGLLMAHEKITLPPDVNKAIENIKTENNLEAPSFVIETLNGEFVGHIGYNYINERDGTFTIGLFLIKEQRGKGYGYAAMRMLLEYAFNERRLHKFDGWCLDDNLVSVKMLKKLGCKQEGIVREEAFLNGKYHNRLLFGMTENEYRQIHNK